MRQEPQFDSGIPILTEVLLDSPPVPPQEPVQNWAQDQLQAQSADQASGQEPAAPVTFAPPAVASAPAAPVTWTPGSFAPPSFTASVWRTGAAMVAGQTLPQPEPQPQFEAAPPAPQHDWAALEQRLNERIVGQVMAHLDGVIEQRVAEALARAADELTANLRSGFQEALAGTVAEIVGAELDEARKQ